MWPKLGHLNQGATFGNSAYSPTWLMKRAMLLAALVIAAVLVGIVLWLRNSGPDASLFADLRDPRLTHMSDERMLVVDATGDPNIVGARAFKQLFGRYYTLERVSRRQRPPAPRARWPKPAETPRQQWVGHYALPVPGAAALPSAARGDLPTSIATWAYGDVAEVLHVGPYSTEEPDINRLLAFVTSKGYRAVGDHEEEYVRGPGAFFAGDPSKYLTIIRLRVEKSR